MGSSAVEPGLGAVDMGNGRPPTFGPTTRDPWAGGPLPGAATMAAQNFPGTSAPRADPPILELPPRGSSAAPPGALPPGIPARTAGDQAAFGQSAADQLGRRPATARPPSVGKAAKRTAQGGGRKKRAPFRAIALLGAAVVVVIIGATGVGPSGPPVTAIVKTFLLDWQQGHYADAARLTTGSPAVVVDSLQSVYSQLGAEDLFLGMGPIAVHGSQARASFDASVDLGRGGLSWHYRGHFNLRRTSSGWRVVWAPSVIVPGLGAGDRLAVLTTMPARAVLLDSEGQSLIPRSSVIELGVVPDKVRDPLRTAERLAKVTGLAQSDAVEMAGQIEAWPPKSFLELVQFTPADYGKLRGRLHEVPGLRVRTARKALFLSTVPVITGQVATETAKTLVDGGEPYRPGTTIGLSGLQLAFQAKLAGSPQTSVVVQNAAGKRVTVLYRWTGNPGSDVRTTINGAVQAAAHNALSAVGLSAAIVAVRAGGGQILAVARTTESGKPAVSPLDGRYRPGQSFTIVSTAALLATGSVGANAPLDCKPTNSVGGQTFANIPAGPNTGASTFRDVFARACSTAFIGLSLKLNASQLISAARTLGIGDTPWKLSLPAFPGRLTNPGGNAGELAADTIGAGSVQVSPLDMALAAGAVDSGSWHAPLIVTSPSAQHPSRLSLSRTVDAQLRGLMRGTVRSGVARDANVPGAPVYGQVGTAPLRGHKGWHAIWFVGFRGGVAFAVVVFARSAAFSPAVHIAGQFATGLPAGS